MIRICTLFIITASTLIFSQKPDRFSYDDMRMIMEKNSLQLQGMKMASGAFSARMGIDNTLCSKAGLGYRYKIDWTYPLAADVGANIFYDSAAKKQILGASLESSLFVLFDTYDSLPLYVGVGAEMKSNARMPLIDPRAIKVPQFMYKIPMPEASITLGKTLLNDSFIQFRYVLPYGISAKGSLGLNYGFGF